MVAEEVLIRRANVVRIHLDILESLLKEPLSPSQAIRASMSLRFLFDGALNRVAHECAIELSIPAPDLTDVPLDQALIFACGGYTISGNEIAPYYAYRQPGPKSPYRAQYDEQVQRSPAHHTLVDVKLGAFQQLTSLAILGTKFTRGAVVRYVANKCGGAHHHDDTLAFDAIEHGLTNVGHSLEIGENELSAVFLETVGTASLLLNAPDVGILRTNLGK